MGFDFWDMLWKPRLVASSMVSGIQSTIGAKKGERKYLPMEHIGGDEYPRPRFVRDSFFSLDGKWEIGDVVSGKAGVFSRSAIVPYPPQASRSGTFGKMAEEFVYRRYFSLPEGFVKDTVILNFGAVDQKAEVYLNGVRLGEHEGGYLPFSFDITKALNTGGENELLVFVTDTLDKKYPYGKQASDPSGMWYQQISGIWQSVWIESVGHEHVTALTYEWDGQGLKILVDGTADSYEMELLLPDGMKRTERLLPGENSIRLDEPRLWSPEDPYLYSYTVRCAGDEVRSYFALRTVGIKRCGNINRIHLNGKPYFFHGVLDQGYFSDGIWTPPSSGWYERDILAMKELGFNTLRKHLKVEPERFYYDCDRLGMFVFQDMVNNGSYSYIRDTILPTLAPFYRGHRKDDRGARVEQETKDFFINHSREIIRHLKGFPSVVYYTVFNEGWGQFESDRVLDILRAEDPGKIYDSTSGWYVQNNSDVESVHVYFHKVPFLKLWKTPIIISEFGGFALRCRKHAIFEGGGYGYGEVKSSEALTDRITRTYREEILPLVRKGVCGSIYTQLADVEEEINGLYTYDRAVCKVDRVKMKELADELYAEFERAVLDF